MPLSKQTLVRLTLFNHIYSEVVPVQTTSRTNVYKGKLRRRSTRKEEEDVG